MFTRVGGCNLSFAHLILSSGPTSSLLCLGWDGRFAYSVKMELRKVGVIWFQASTLYTQLWGPGCTEAGWWVGGSCLPGRCPCRVLSPVPIGQVRTPSLTQPGPCLEAWPRLRGAGESANHALLCIQLSVAPQCPRHHVPISSCPLPMGRIKHLLRIPTPDYAMVSV